MFKFVKEVTHNSLMYSDSNCDIFLHCKSFAKREGMKR